MEVYKSRIGLAVVGCAYHYIVALCKSVNINSEVVMKADFTDEDKRWYVIAPSVGTPMLLRLLKLGCDLNWLLGGQGRCASRDGQVII